MFCSRRVEQLSSIPNNRPIVLDGSNNNPINSVDQAIEIFYKVQEAPNQNKYLIKEAIQDKYIASSNNRNDNTNNTKMQLDQLMSNLIQLRYIVAQKASFSKNDATVEVDKNDNDMHRCIWNICNLCNRGNLNLNVALTLSLVFNSSTGNSKLWYFGYKEMPRNLKELSHFAYEHGCTFRLTSESRRWLYYTYPEYEKEHLKCDIMKGNFLGTNCEDNVTNLFPIQQIDQEDNVRKSQNLINNHSEVVTSIVTRNYNKSYNESKHPGYSRILATVYKGSAYNQIMLSENWDATNN